MSDGSTNLTEWLLGQLDRYFNSHLKPRFLMKQANEARKNGEFTKAIELYGKVIEAIEETEEDSPQEDIIKALLLRYIAELYLELEKPDEALAKLELSIKLNPKDARVYYLLGRSYFDRNEFEDAYNYFKQAHALEPARTEYMLAIGRAAYELGSYDETIEILEEHAEALRDFARPRRHASDAELPCVIERGEGAYVLARAYFQKGAYDKARAHLEIAFNIDPSNLEVIYLLASTLMRLGEQDRALELFNEITRKDYAESDVYLEVAGIYHYGKGDLNRALDMYRKYLALEPDDAPVLYSAATLAKETGDLNLALELASRAANLEKTNALYRLFEAELLVELERPALAREKAELVIEMLERKGEPTEEELDLLLAANLVRGKLLFKANRWKEAKQIFETVRYSSRFDRTAVSMLEEMETHCDELPYILLLPVMDGEKMVSVMMSSQRGSLPLERKILEPAYSRGVDGDLVFLLEGDLPLVTVFPPSKKEIYLKEFKDFLGQSVEENLWNLFEIEVYVEPVRDEYRSITLIEKLDALSAARKAVPSDCSVASFESIRIEAAALLEELMEEVACQEGLEELIQDLNPEWPLSSFFKTATGFKRPETLKGPSREVSSPSNDSEIKKKQPASEDAILL